MKVNDPNLSSVGPGGASRAQETTRTTESGRAKNAYGVGPSALSDDVHLSELVRSLRALASDSPERQALVEKLERAVAEGKYEIDAKAISQKLIEDAMLGD